MRYLWKHTDIELSKKKKKPKYPNKEGIKVDTRHSRIVVFQKWQLIHLST